MLAGIGSNQNLSKLREAETLADAIEKADNYCGNCKASSPMICVERCDVWRLKHEILETRRLIGESNHKRQLLNVLKNKRRLKVLDVLCERSLSAKELQRTLRESGFYHSRRTIAEAYLKPMIKVGLVREEGVLIKVTFYGRKIRDKLAQLDSMSLLPIHSCCYEEMVLKLLDSEPKTFNELALNVPLKSLSRILMRLRAKGLLVKSSLTDHVFYHRVERNRKIRLSPTEERVFEAIPQTGISVRQLTKVVGISLRRTFKYLRRLKEKKIVFAFKARKNYELTLEGRKIVNALDEIEKLALSSLDLPVPVAHNLP